MEVLLIIKNIWDKIYFHPLFYFIVVISFLTGHFRNIFYFTIIILVHELGHSIIGILLGIKLDRIEIYPYGGCSKLNYDINIRLYKELLILIAGPITQILFTYLVYYLKIDVLDYFYTYSKFILLFNLLPIYPLDGGRIINILLSYIISFYNSLKYTYYFSYFIMCIITFISFRYNKNLIIYLIVISLIIELFKQIKIRNYIFKKFLLERYLYDYNFKKIKKIYNIYNMKRDYNHFFKINNSFITEKEYLKTMF